MRLGFSTASKTFMGPVHKGHRVKSTEKHGLKDEPKLASMASGDFGAIWSPEASFCAKVADCIDSVDRPEFPLGCSVPWPDFEWSAEQCTDFQITSVP